MANNAKNKLVLLMLSLLDFVLDTVIDFISNILLVSTI